MSLSGNRGFTLLEILASIAILAIVVTALFRLHLQTLAMGAASRFYNHAPLLAQEKLAQVEAKGPELLPLDSGKFGPRFPFYRWEVSIAGSAFSELGVETDMLVRIDIRIVNEETDNAYSLRTYRYRPAAGTD